MSTFVRLISLLFLTTVMAVPHAMQQDEKGDINYAGLFKTFGQFRFNNIRKALKNGGVTLTGNMISKPNEE